MKNIYKRRNLSIYHLIYTITFFFGKKHEVLNYIHSIMVIHCGQGGMYVKAKEYGLQCLILLF